MPGPGCRGWQPDSVAALVALCLSQYVVEQFTGKATEERKQRLVSGAEQLPVLSVEYLDDAQQLSVADEGDREEGAGSESEHDIEGVVEALIFVGIVDDGGAAIFHDPAHDALPGRNTTPAQGGLDFSAHGGEDQLVGVFVHGQQGAIPGVGYFERALQYAVQ